ncbi:MetQ/NlpA family ABC transporter substrate-binding protein [Granulicella sp. dw_53]|uniref:MetQ/NlpA family ABC transporter substrate-binding protein n=1 Tax=Granulicella sp. dw_53 TaxID=2719792 RepID=UPI001BD284D7|nr:MetQ/NlpA family ABC transporter substrate-binding protein [Granulicella sp. dw_53]
MLYRKFTAIALTLVVAVLSGCRNHSSRLRIGVTPGPAEEILASIAPELARDGVELQIVPFTDYVQPNLALAGKDLDANLYQNIPFLSQFNRDHSTNFVPVAKVYVPLMGIYPGRTKSLAGLHDGAQVSLPNDPVNQSRALYLLQTAGLISLRKGLGNQATLADVIYGPHPLKLVELDASQLPRSRQDVDLAVINANFALDAGLNPNRDAVLHESLDSVYVNVLVTNSSQQSDPRIVKLGESLRSTTAKSFIAGHYNGAIVPAT